jgi:hypothetical protein
MTRTSHTPDLNQRARPSVRLATTQSLGWRESAGRLCVVIGTQLFVSGRPIEAAPHNADSHASPHDPFGWCAGGLREPPSYGRPATTHRYLRMAAQRPGTTAVAPGSRHPQTSRQRERPKRSLQGFATRRVLLGGIYGVDLTAVSAERKCQEPAVSISTPNRATNGADSSRAFAGLPEASARRVRDFLGKPGRLLIDGAWVEAVSGKTFETFNPATEESLGWVAHGAGEDVELAVAAARRCFDDERSDWRRMTPSERGKVIHRICDLIERHADREGGCARDARQRQSR